MPESVHLIFSHTAMSSLPHDNEQYGSKDYWREQDLTVEPPRTN
jgi:hypothetical protein